MEQQQKENVINSLVQAIVHMGESAIEKAISGLIYHRHDTSVQTEDTHPCPPGQIWNGKQCVDDIG